MPNNNLNVVDIWKEVSNIGSTTFVNVTDGTERTVPWGQLQWFGLLGSLIFPTAVLIWLALMASKYLH